MRPAGEDKARLRARQNEGPGRAGPRLLDETTAVWQRGHEKGLHMTNLTTPPTRTRPAPSLRQLLIAFAKGVGLLFAGVFVAASLLGLYWWFATYVLLPTSRLQEVPATIVEAAAGERGGPQATAAAPQVSQATADIGAGFWSRVRAELATMDEHLAARRGTFGDMFGAVNAFFSALAFACVFYALILQRQDLRLQRQELEDTRLVAVTSALLQAHTGNIEAAFQAARLKESSMSQDLVAEIAASRNQIKTLLSRLNTE